jgi:hypothetical protein
MRGDLAAAQAEAEAACEELRPYLRREFGWPLTELGTIRLRRGDLAGARTAFLDAHRAGWDPQPGLALLCLQEGDASTAASMVDQALERPLGVPSKELPPDTALRRAPLLAAQVQVSVAMARPEVARSAARELTQVAEAYTSPALEADAAFAAGTVDLVEGHLGDARRAHQRALDLYSELTMPYEAAWARIGLAHANRAEGVPELATLEIETAEGILREIGAAAPRLAADRVGPGREADPHERVTSAGGSRASVGRMLLEGDHISLSFGGRTVPLRDLKGLRYLARLLAEPDREVHALDLVTADEERTARAEVEREFLIRELSRAVGLGGRDRPTGATAERARVSVTRAVRYALRRVDEHHPELGAHLDHAVRTGTYLAYEPDPRAMVRWTVPDR